MTKLYYDADADLSLLHGRRIAIIGYGSQGHAHALNLKESGCDVVVGIRPGSEGWARAEADGWQPQSPADAVIGADIIGIFVPDHIQVELWNSTILPALGPRSTVLFAHGFNIHFGTIVPPKDVDVIMVAPKGPGHLVRRLYSQGEGVPCLIAIEQDATGEAQQTALAWASGIGGARAGVLETTFAEETVTDLFGEQAVLCGGASALVQAGFETLVAAGYQPEIAYFECLHELKLIVDLMYEGGLAGMRYSISDTAEYGDLTRGPHDRRRPREADHEGHPREHPDRPVRARVRQRERDRPLGAEVAARPQLGAPDRGGRRAPARDDAVRQGRQGPGEGSYG